MATYSIKFYCDAWSIIVNTFWRITQNSWINCVEISLNADKNYVVSSNGYIPMLPKNTYDNNLSINNNIIDFKLTGSYYSYGNIMFIPVFDGDVLSTTVDIEKIYFLPSKEVTLEDF